MVEVVTERKTADMRSREYEQRARNLEARLEQASHSNSDVEIFRRRLTEQMEEERDQYQKDLAERDFSLDQTRKKYQSVYSLSSSTPCRATNFPLLKPNLRN